MIEKKVTSIDEIGMANGVVIGHEGCIYRALDRNNLVIADFCARNNIQIRFVTPIIPESFMETALSFIKELVDIAEAVILKITFNDLGLFHSCLPFSDHFIPVLGRIISRSLIDCPWYNRLISNETSDVQQALMGYTFFHESKKQMFLLHGVQEVEVNVAPFQYLRELVEQNIEITVYSDNKLISTSRVCYSSMLLGHSVNKGCKSFVCADIVPISLDKIWDKTSRMRMIPPLEVKELYRDLYIQGTQVFISVSKTEVEALVREKCIRNLII